MIKRLRTVNWVSRSLGLSLAATLAMAGCATSYRDVEVTTGNTRMVKASHSYCFRANMPSAEEPNLKFKLVRVDEFEPEKEVEYQKIRERSVGLFDGLLLLPFQIVLGIVSFGNINVYQSVKSEDVVESDTRWEPDAAGRNSRKDEALAGIPVMLTYDYADELITINDQTNQNGEVRKDVRRLARSIALDPNAAEAVTFKATAPPPYNCNHKVTIRQEEFIDLYQTLSEEGLLNSFIRRLKRLFS